MILLVDLGNTRIKWCEYARGRAATARASAYRPTRSITPEPDAPARLLPFETVLDDIWAGLEKPESIVLCNVAGREMGRQFNDWVAKNWACPVRQLRSVQELAGVRNAYREPERLGIDRLVAMVGARSLFEGPLCVVDAGTAITLDAVDGRGRHLGGLIAPGPEMMLTALGQTGDILMDREGEVTEFATATPDAVVSGVMLSVIALIQRFVAATCEKLGQNVTLVVTGGAGPRILLNLSDARFEPDLVLRGLAEIARVQSEEHG